MVGVNIPLRTLTGNENDPLYRPDVGGLRPSGEIDVIEIPSPTDRKSELQTRGTTGLAGLQPPSHPGMVRVTPKCQRK